MQEQLGRLWVVGAALITIGLAGLVLVPANTVATDKVVSATGQNTGPGLSFLDYQILLTVSWLALAAGILCTLAWLASRCREEAR
jgi:hypothetical protein